MSLLATLRNQALKVLRKPEYSELREGFTDAELRQEVWRNIFAPQNPSEYLWSPIVLILHPPFPAEDEIFREQFLEEVAENVRSQGFDMYFEGLIWGQVGVVHIVEVAEEVKSLIAPLVGKDELKFGGSLYAQFERYSIHSPLEQIFFATWEYIRNTYYQDFQKPDSRFFWRFRLYPQFAVYRDKVPDKPDNLEYEAYKAYLDAKQSARV